MGPRSLRLAALALFAGASACSSTEPAAAPPRGSMPVATYSIVARDPASGELGVAVQSHWFSVGPIVPWAEAGVGAVATQSFVDVSYGPLALELLKSGRSPEQTLEGLTAADSGADVRQVAVISTSGEVAAHTGAKCIPMAGHQTGAGYSVQANLMERATVWPAMARAFESASGDLAERMLQALEAAEREGGDIRGRQSAAILVVRASPTGRPWEDRLVDLRVEDHSQPLVELRRLVRLGRAYRKMNEGDEALAKKDVGGALARYSEAESLAPEAYEIPFWVAATLCMAGRTEDALPRFAASFRAEPRLCELVARLPSVGLLPDDPALIERIGAIR
jgi:uncharacterized Ntn-hydrolase superfamily protein